MYAWEPSFMKKVQTIRNMEISKLWSYAILTATNIVFAIHSPFIVRKLLYLVNKHKASTTGMFAICKFKSVTFATLQLIREYQVVSCNTYCNKYCFFFYTLSVHHK